MSIVHSRVDRPVDGRMSEFDEGIVAFGEALAGDEGLRSFGCTKWGWMGGRDNDVSFAVDMFGLGKCWFSPAQKYNWFPILTTVRI